jgi:hypothetical protein
MPLASIPSDEAFASLRTNRNARWPQRSNEPNRLEPICKPGFSPSFKLRPQEPVFTMGSCFARNIEKQLRRLGYKTPAGDYRPREMTEAEAPGFMNKFTPHSMLNELMWALTPDEVPDPEVALLDMKDGTFIDGQVMSKIALDRDSCMIRRREMTDVFRGIASCRVTIITLGLVEAWFDTQTGIYLNRDLPRPISTANPGRFELHILSYEELYAATRSMIELIIRFGHPEARIVLTVSPVPLLATFSGMDVITANMYSKSSLRTVAEHVVRQFDQVDYFPSFESVMLSDRSLAWKEDLGHVTEDLVRINVGRMAEGYAYSETGAALARKIAEG